MHRAEKSSSRICRNREVERAQELHRKKIDGVKSYLTGVVSRPTAVKPIVGATFRRFKPAASSLSLHCSAADVEDGGSESEDDANEDGDDDMLSADDSGAFGSSAPMSSAGSAFFNAPSGGGSDNASGFALNAMEPHASVAFAIDKADEFRSVAPVPLLAKQPSHQQQQQLLLHARAPATGNGSAALKKNSLNSSFRTRRLKEIRADNVGLFERIRKSAAHYRNDDLKREWAQNVSYLSSICEFPVVLASPRSQHQRHGDSSEGDEEEQGGSMHSGLSTPVRHHQHLPRIHQPAAVHPIRAVPTSPRRLQLNLSPAFRSLRKGMPQQPALPPISTSPSTSTFGSLAPPPSVFASSSAMASSVSIAGYKFHGSSSQDSHPVDASESDSDGHVNDSDVPTLPSRATSVGSPFAGDLSFPSNTQLHETKYQLLKLGRFVGGTYLVLTVFCGDGVHNPYGFDVFAFDRASQCEFRLCVTKQMTHELLDTISSSSQAAATAAAAGTNLSMEQIARSICDHVNFATLESGLGEMAFLTANVGGSTSRTDHCALLLDTASSSIALCLHQCVEIEMATSSVALAEALSDAATSGKRKRKLHVFASTRPQKSTPATYDESAAGRLSSSETVCFQIRDVDSHVATTQGVSTSPALALEVEIELHELYAIVSGQWHGNDSNSPSSKSSHKRKKRTKTSQAKQSSLAMHVSIERVITAAIRHLHIVNVPSGDTGDELTQVLIVNRHVNALLHPVPHALAKMRALEKTRSRQHLPRAASSPTRALSHITRGVRVLESGVIWKNAYVLARVSIDSNSDGNGSDDDSESCDDREHAESATPQYIQDIETSVRVVVFNSLTSKYSERALCPEQVDAVVAKLDALILADDDTEFQETSAFVKQLLLRLEIEVDLFGTEVLTFPTLDIKQPLNSHTEQLSSHHYCNTGSASTASSRRSLIGRHAINRTIGLGESKRVHEDDDSEVDEDDDGVDVDAAATRIQAHVRGFLFRSQYYGAGDEQLDDDLDRDAECDRREHNRSDAVDAGETMAVHADSGDHCKARDQHTEMQFQCSASRSESRSRTQREATTECEVVQPDGNNVQADCLHDIELNTVSSAPPEALPAPAAQAGAMARPSSSSSEQNPLASADVRSGVKIDHAFCLVREAAELHRDASGSKRVVYTIGALGQLDRQDAARARDNEQSGGI